MLALYTATIVLASALLFMVQPMVGKMILPRGGGSPQVWMASLVFFQAALLAGYAYAHWSIRALGARRQSWLHGAMLLLPLLVLPLALPESARPAGAAPSLWILRLLVLGIGLPFVVLAASSPLLQAWLAATRHKDAEDPYFLYAGSNVGSLVGLLSYPLLLEPLLPVSAQTTLWTGGYILLLVLFVACAIWARRAGIREVSPAQLVPGERDGSSPSMADRAFWLFAAAVPSALLLGVTHYLTSRIAPVPLLWVLPLGLYLVTFIVAFGRRQRFSLEMVSRTFAVLAVIGALLLLTLMREPIWLITLLHLGVLTSASLLCNMRLAARRPAAQHLTGFYLWISLGGVLGGAFSALLAPVFFNSIAEYPVALAGAALLLVSRDGERLSKAGLTPRALAGPLALAAYLLLGGWIAGPGSSFGEGLLTVAFIVVPVAVVYFFSFRALPFALGLAILFGLVRSDWVYRGDVLHQQRTFFGIYRVVRDPPETFHILYHGSAVHGMEGLTPESRGEPVAYYHRSGPAGGIMAALAEQPDKERIALVGAGTGALAALAGDHQRLTLYEIDPEVMDIAEEPRWFTFLEDTPAEYETVIGDGRLEMAARDERYDLIVLDAFTSGSIPIHLLTREAIQLYLDHLEPGGALLFHISNAYLELAPVLGAHVRDLGLVGYDAVDVQPDNDQGIMSSHWAIMVRQPADLEGLPGTGWRPLVTPPEVQAWTDDFSNLLTAQRWF